MKVSVEVSKVFRFELSESELTDLILALYDAEYFNNLDKEMFPDEPMRYIAKRCREMRERFQSLRGE